MISYKKLWKLLIDKDLKKQDLVKLAGIGQSTLYKLNKGETVNLEIIVRICDALNCTSADIMDITPIVRKDGE